MSRHADPMWEALFGQLVALRGLAESLVATADALLARGAEAEVPAGGAPPEAEPAAEPATPEVQEAASRIFGRARRRAAAEETPSPSTGVPDGST